MDFSRPALDPFFPLVGLFVLEEGFGLLFGAARSV
jgi:hypothetical protein